jgi:glycosyltransferase
VTRSTFRSPIVVNRDPQSARSGLDPDEGVYGAMNKGVGLATGELVYFLNSDDRLADPNVVADIVRRLEARPPI